MRHPPFGLPGPLSLALACLSPSAFRPLFDATVKEDQALVGTNVGIANRGLMPQPGNSMSTRLDRTELAFEVDAHQ